jgi:hypothetical protein
MNLSPSAISFRPCLLPLAAALILPVSASYAEIFTLTAHLSGANEVPATPSLGTGRPR